MKVFHSLEGIERIPGAVVTVGSFDGVHLGHRAILKTLCDRAAEINAVPVVVTFDPHPREVLGKGQVEYLTTLGERLELLDRAGVKATIILKFTFEFSRLSAEQFYLGVLLPAIGLKEVIVGHDHQFGRDRAAGFSEIERIGMSAGFAATLVPPVQSEKGIVSSSSIRALLREGDVSSVSGLLGYPYRLTGAVVAGQGRGRTIGFPTANILPAPVKAIPANGVYIVRARQVVHGSNPRLTGSVSGMMNIGVRPTFEDAGARSLEVHFPGFTGDLYGTDLELSFHKRIRAEQKFGSKEELMQQLERDRQECLVADHEFLNSPAD